MPTIIDSLIVKLGLADGDFQLKASLATKKMKDAEKASGDLEKRGKTLAMSHRGVAKSFGEVALAATKFLAVIGGAVAIRSFITDIVVSNAEISRFARNIGLSTETASAWGQVAEQMGGSAKGVQGTFDMLSKSQTELMLTGQSALIPYFSALGVALVGVGGKARPVDQILLDLAGRFSKMDRTTANNMGRMMGIDQGTMNLLLQGKGALEKQIAEQKKSLALTKAQGEEDERLQKAQAKLKQEWVAFARQLLQDAEPVLKQILGWFKNLEEWLKGHKEGVESFIKIFSGFLVLVTIFKTVSSIVRGFLTIVEAIGPALELLSGPIGWVVTAIAALAAGIMYLKHDYDVWRAGGDSLIDWEKWKPEIDAATALIKKLGEMISWVADKAKDLWESVSQSKFGKFVGNAVSTGFTAVKNAIGIKGPAMKPEEIQKYFMQQGWSKEQAAGIASNLMTESGGQKAAIGDNGKAYGLGQWHSDRQAEFKRVFGKDITSATNEDQMAFVQYELTQGNERKAGNNLKKATNAGEAAAVVSKQYERPADTQGEAQRRGQLAESYVNGQHPTGPVKSAPTNPLRQSDAIASNPQMASTTTVDRSVSVGEVKVYSAATDANGIAKDMGKSMNYLFTTQANSGIIG